MLHEHAKLLSLLKGTGEVVGRKKLQKMVYIAKRLNQPFHEKYQFHMYGPYSEELTLKIEEMCQAEFVSELREKKAGYYQYRYELSEKGEQFLEAVQPGEEIDRAMLLELNGCSSKFLELVSTVLYFDHLPEEEVKKKVYKVKAKQNYSEEDIDQAYAYIATLRPH
ncbi:YwgA family protein [Alkalicoccus halolimnae]|uniref:YwgA family protein n=1 Tax=Alkalicoccus halolimnae TaxID=1667239 RepID=A0A5C7F9X2_9BACI|nr:YwgA family protein [Alkalicoccus halolimnae]TXF86903.1 YwgA family protein [Alkalicoccus halolimnae]